MIEEYISDRWGDSSPAALFKHYSSMQTKHIFARAICLTAAVLLSTACSSRKDVAVNSQIADSQSWEAPSSIQGSTVVWHDTDGSERKELYTAIRNPKTGLTPDGYDCPYDGAFFAKELDIDEGGQYWGYDYKKTGRNTGVLYSYGSESGTAYFLNFDSATTGTASYQGGGEGDTWEGSGLRFTIE